MAYNLPLPADIEALTLVDLLSWRAQMQPQQTAYTFLLDGETKAAQISYQQLDRQAQAIQKLLVSLGVTNQRALLIYPPGLDYIAAFFGCLYAGVVAVPIYPPRKNRSLLRLQAIIADAQATVALTTSDLLPMVQPLLAEAGNATPLHWVTTDSLDAGSDAIAPLKIAPEQLAFLQYTSGSTSTPKGVMLSHSNLIHNLDLIQRSFNHTPESQGVIWLPPYHDMGLIGGILQPLYAGFPVTLLSPVAFLQRPLRWLQAISHYRATTSGGPNFAYNLCIERITPEQRATLDLSSWTVAFNGAEPIRAETLERFAATFAECGFRREALYPCYGLAEATVLVSGDSIDRQPVLQTVASDALAAHTVIATEPDATEARQLVSSGRERPGVRLQIVDPQTCIRCASGTIGEIWVAGPSVAQGYWSQPEATTSTFAARLADTGEGPFLRTGDLGFLRDGELFVTGRIKDLIIIRGRNHYPQDIEETVGRSHPALRLGGGAAFSVELGGEERLVIVHELERDHRRADSATVAAAVRQAVAAQHELQTSAVVLIKPGSLPKTSSGKIQRQACKAQLLAGELDILGQSWLDESADSGAPEDDLSRDQLLAYAPAERHAVLAADLRSRIAHILRIHPDDIAVEQPLIALGLDSLAAIELSHDLETRLGVQGSLSMILEGTSVATLAETLLSQLGTALPALIVPRDPAAAHPLSQGQRALWYLQQLAPNSTAYTIARALRITGKLDVEALRQSLQALVDRHAALRTTFSLHNNEPVQHVHSTMPVALSVEDASAWSAAARDAEMLAEAQRPFDLERGPLMRARLFTSAADKHLLLVFHHIAVDLWSIVLLLYELRVLYPAARHGGSALLPPPPIQYTDYVYWQNDLLASGEGERLWSYWQRRLAEPLPTLDLPTDAPRAPIQSYQGAQYVFTLDEQITRSLRELAQQSGATLYMTLLAIFTTLLFRYTGQQDLVIGAATTGRRRAELAGLVGYLVNPVVLRIDLAGNPAFADLLRQVRQTVLGALDHQEYPFPLLVERLQPIHDPSRSPLFQVMFVLEKPQLASAQDLAAFILGHSGHPLLLDDLTLEPHPLQQDVAQFDLTLTVVAEGDSLTAGIEYNTALFEALTIQRLAEHFTLLAQTIGAHAQQRLADLDLLTPVEHSLIRGWNATVRDYPRNRTLIELFDACVDHMPDHVAVVLADLAAVQEQITYRELDRRANQLAHHLRGLGVGPDCLVGLCVERSINLVIGILGILKAGGAYVPLDPTYPQERLALMLDTAGVAILLTQERLRAVLPEPIPHVVDLDRDQPMLQQASTERLPMSAAPANLAYVLFTSGSTGRPKGVACHHAGVVNLLDAFQRGWPVPTGAAWSLWASLSFDASVYELFSALLSGGRLEIVPEPIRPDPAAFLQWLEARQIESAFLPPFMVEDLTAAIAQRPERWAFKRLMVGVEPLRGELLATIGRHLPEVKVINAYGPTETTVCSTLYAVDPHAEHQGNTPIGFPLQNSSIYLLDAQMQLVPVGTTGEVYIGGDGLARGYLSRPDLTAERFVPNPWADRPGSRLYRTGDLARYAPDGALRFMGRSDNQVKLRGVRIELGEIEAVLRQHADVREAIVQVSADTYERKQLVAYVVPRDSHVPSSADLRAWLHQRLPSSMLPGAFVMLEQLPLLPNGKLDRRRLAALDRDQRQQAIAFVAPHSLTEQTLAAIWADLLAVERVGAQDHFFELGGHSLLATQLVSRIDEAFQIRLPLQHILQTPTLAELARSIDTLVWVAQEQGGVDDAPAEDHEEFIL